MDDPRPSVHHYNTLSEIEAWKCVLAREVEHAVVLTDGVPEAVGVERVGLREHVQGLAQDVNDLLVWIVDCLASEKLNRNK